MLPLWHALSVEESFPILLHAFFTQKNFFNLCTPENWGLDFIARIFICQTVDRAFFKRITEVLIMFFPCYM